MVGTRLHRSGTADRDCELIAPLQQAAHLLYGRPVSSTLDGIR